MSTDQARSTQLHVLSEHNGEKWTSTSCGTSRPSDARKFTTLRAEKYWIVFAAFFMYINTWGTLSTYGIFQDHYQEVLSDAGVSPSAIAWIGSLQIFLGMGLGLITGPLYDRGYLRFLVVIGNAAIVAGMLATSFVNVYRDLLICQGLCVGIGIGTIYVPCLAAVNAAFAEDARKKPLAIGVASLGGPLGGVILPIMLRTIISRVDFVWGVRALALVNLVGSVAICVPCMICSAASLGISRRIFDTTIFHDGPFLLFAFAILVTYLPYYAPLTYIPTYAQTVLEVNPQLAGYMPAIAMAGSFFGRTIPFLPLPSRIFKPIFLLIFWALACSLLFFAWAAVTSLRGFIAWCLFWGLSSGALVVAPTATIAHPALASPNSENLGSRMGFAWAAAALGELVGPPIVGALVTDSGGSYLHACLVGGCILAAGAVLLMVGPLRTITKYDQNST